MIVTELEELIDRLNNFFTIQTQEVIPILNRIKERLDKIDENIIEVVPESVETQFVIEPEVIINDEPTPEVKEVPVETNPEIIPVSEPTTEVARAIEFLIDKAIAL